MRYIKENGTYENKFEIEGLEQWENIVTRMKTLASIPLNESQGEGEFFTTIENKKFSIHETISEDPKILLAIQQV